VRNAAATALLAALATAAVGGRSAAGDWPRWRGPQCDGVATESGWFQPWPAGGPKRLWKANVGTGFSSLAVSGPRLCTMGNVNGQETIYGLEAGSGRVLWRHTYACARMPNLYEGGPNATPTIDGDRVYTLSRKGHVFCLDVRSGLVVWSKNIQAELSLRVPEWGFSGSPLVEGDLLILNAGTSGTALDKRTGAVVWTTGPSLAGYASPLPFEDRGRRRVLVFTADRLVAMDPQSGQPAWAHPWQTSYKLNAADPNVAGSRVFISSGYNEGGAQLHIGGAGPTVLWRNKNLRTQFNPAVLVGGHLYGIDGNVTQKASLKCVTLDTGEVRWSAADVGFGSLIAADGKLIVLTGRGELIVAEASPEAFTPLARAQVLGGKCWTTPVLANGRIYCRNAAGEVVCLQITSPNAATD
jgi:outer membrane protein assembly factor BamB